MLTSDALFNNLATLAPEETRKPKDTPSRQNISQPAQPQISQSQVQNIDNPPIKIEHTQNEVVQNDRIQNYSMQFLGTGSEYFRIWIVNIVLSVLTLGIYSAWAKVRRERFLCRSMRLDHSSFDFHAQPKNILFGRLLVLALVGIYFFLKNLNPIFGKLAIVLIIVFIPWLFIRTIKFRAHNTSYRGIRFQFHGTYWPAFKVYVLYTVLTIATIGLFYPLQYCAIRSFVTNNTRYGNADFKGDFKKTEFYWPFAIALLVYLLVYFVILLIVSIILIAIIMIYPDKFSDYQQFSAMVHNHTLLFSSIFVILLVAFALFQRFMLAALFNVYMANLVWNNTSLTTHSNDAASAGVRFKCEMQLWRYCLKVLYNGLLLLVSGMLYWPWAVVNMLTYRASRFSVLAASLAEVSAVAEPEISAFSDQMSSIFDLDVSI